MFANNQKISLRQTFRLFVFDLLGIGTLLLPTQLALLCGNAGIWCILFGGILGFIYLLLLGAVMKKMQMDLIAYINKCIPKGIGIILFLILGVYSILFASFASCFFARLVKDTLIPEEKFIVILAFLMFVSGYAICGGMESRARVYEILFLFVLISLGGMLFAATKNVSVELLHPIVEASVTGIGKGTYLVFLLFLILFYILFFPTSIQKDKQDRLIPTVAGALGLVLVILLVTYLVLIGNFGARALVNMKYPIITLMSTVQIKGSFFKRTDALMFGIWFFTLFAIINLHVYYGAQLLGQLVGKVGNKRYIAIICSVVYGVALLFQYKEGWMQGYMKFMEKIGGVLLIIIPIGILLMGCNSVELEDRCFPMLAIVDYDGNTEQVTFSYEFPKAGIKSKEGQEVAEISVKPIGGKDFMEARKNFDQTLSKKTDTNHLKVIVFGEEFLKNREQCLKMLSLLQKEEEFPRNTYVCVMKNTRELSKIKKNLSVDFGSYLEELVENHDRKKGRKLADIGMLMDEKDNQKRVLYLPYLQVDQDNLLWKREYEINWNKSW